MNVLQSASKIVFIALALALIVLTYLGRVEAKDFVTLTGMAFVYYFTKAPSPSGTISATVSASVPPTTDTN